MARITKAERTRMETAIALDAARRKADHLKTIISDLQTSLLEQIGDTKSFTVEDHDGRVLRVTRVQNTTMVINEPALKSKVDAATWNKVTTRVLDRKKLEAYIASSEVDPMIVSVCSTEKQSAPFIKISDRG